jgi:quinol monooxygenase YgiN
MILIAGVVDIDPEQMDAAMAAARPLIEGALTQPGCEAYAWCPDPTTPGRIYVFERWSSQEELASHFQNHWYSDMLQAIGSHGLRGADVSKFKIALEEPVYDSSGKPRAHFVTESA